MRRIGHSGTFSRVRAFCRNGFPFYPPLPSRHRAAVDGCVFPPGGFKNGPARPATPRVKSTRVVLKIIMVTLRFCNICVWAPSVFPSPRSCAVSLRFGWSLSCSCAVEPFQLHAGLLFDGVGRLGSRILIFGRCF